MSMEVQTLRNATCKMLQLFGIGILDEPERCLGALADLIDGDSAEAKVLYDNCDKMLLSRFSESAKKGTKEGLAATRKGTIGYLTNECWVSEEIAARVADGLANGIADWLGLGIESGVSEECPIPDASKTIVCKSDYALFKGENVTDVSDNAYAIESYCLAGDAGDRGTELARYGLASVYTEGRQTDVDTPASSPNGVQCYKDALDILSTHGGVPDYVAAVRLLHIATQHGVLQAHTYLGILYYCGGKGVRINYNEARKQFEYAADRGDAKAMYNLGLYYYEGKAIERDYRLAYYWLKQSADCGIIQSNEKLYDILRTGGYGMEQDLIAAHYYERNLNKQ